MSLPPSSPSDPSRPANVIMVGMMGCGKSSIGRTVAENLKLTFVDTDDMIVEEAGCSIPEVFESEGEDGFRRRERAALISLRGIKNRVIATGGGIVLSQDNRQALRSLGYVVWLTASLDTLLFRVSQTRGRPLVQTENPRERLAELMDQRQSLYESVSDIVVDTTDLTPCETVHGLIDCVNYHFHSECE